ncbi:MAG: hypothetical protein WC273_08750 [Dehalococcoidia bacterium]
MTGKGSPGTVTRIAAAGAAALAASAVLPAAALAHTGADVPLSHTLLEVGQWALGVAGVLGAAIGLLWARARLRGRGE